MVCLNAWIQKKGFKRKALILITGGPILIGLYLLTLANYGSLLSWLAGASVDVGIILLVSMLTYKMVYTLRKAILFPFLIRLIVILIEGFIYEMHYFLMLFIPLLLLLVAVCAPKKMRKNLYQSENFQSILITELYIFFVASQGVLTFQRHLSDSPEIAVLAIVLLAGFLITTVMTIFSHMKVEVEKHHIQQQKDEYTFMSHYTAEVEKQYTDVQKFKHDYQNILSSLSGFIEEEDHAGLKSYFNKKIKPASEKSMEQSFAFKNLSNITVKEVKSILATKLIMATENKISANLEVKENIDDIPIDTVNLVRMLGIVLDNAIEELKELNQGLLQIAAWKEKDQIVFIVQNTCRTNLPRLHQLEVHGFSSKGEKRGVGLTNLRELAEKENNVLLHTSINDDQFIQKITILGG